MITRDDKCAVLVSFVICYCATAGVVTSHNTPNYFTHDTTKPVLVPTNATAIASTSANLVVQLAIICDLDFSNLFQNDEAKMLEYWKAVLYDVHLRYQTLPSFKFSFQITSLQVLKEPVSFIEKCRDDINQVDVRAVLTRMYKWLGPQVDQVPSFDIAVLVLGAISWGPYDNPMAIGRQGSICLGNSIPGEWISNIVVCVREPDVAGLVAHVIGHVLGAPFDGEKSYLQHECGPYSDNWEQTFIMNPNDSKHRHFFSNCTNKILAEPFENLTHECLLPNGLGTNVLYDTGSLVPGLLSIEYQCRIRTNACITGTKQYIEGEFCDWIECKNLKPFKAKPDYIKPLDGTPCGTDTMGRCIRGFCLLPGVNLVNVATGKCLQNFKGDLEVPAVPKMNNCSYG